MKPFLAQFHIYEANKSQVVKIEDDSVVVTNFYRAMKLLIDFTIQSRFDGDICSQSIYLETEERQKNEVGAKAVRQDKLFFII